MKICGTESTDYILRELGSRLKDIRIRRNMTQHEMARNAGVSFSTIVRIEKGESVNLDNFIRAIRVFGLLENFDLLIPEQRQTPEEIYRGIPKKKRAYKLQIKNHNEWMWEDEKE